MSPLGIGGSGLLGLGFETTRGEYVAPTKFVPIRNESIVDTEDKQVLTPIRGVPTASYVKRGYKVIEGDIEFEVTADALPYFLYLARTEPEKTGASAPFTYTFNPSNVVLPDTDTGPGTRKTASLYIERAEQVFAYLGCSVTSLTFGIDAGDLICTAHIFGLAPDTAQSSVTPTFAAFAPFGPGDIAISIPNTAPRVDIDTFSVLIQDNGEALNRIRQGGPQVRGPSYIKWGEREVSGSFDHDFQDLTEYNVFTNNNFRTLRINANHGPDDSVQVDLANIISQSYPVNLGGAMGDLVRASVDFRAIYSGTPEYVVTVVTDEDIT